MTESGWDTGHHDDETELASSSGGFFMTESGWDTGHHDDDETELASSSGFFPILALALVIKKDRTTSSKSSSTTTDLLSVSATIVLAMSWSLFSSTTLI
jgi:hypothetical protein